MAVAQTKLRSYSSTDDKGAVQSSPKVPWYMEQVYWWAYMRPFSLALFDHVWIVSLILFGNYGKLKRAALAEISNGQSVLQAACVYGDLSGLLAEKVDLTTFTRLEMNGFSSLGISILRTSNSRFSLVRLFSSFASINFKYSSTRRSCRSGFS